MPRENQVGLSSEAGRWPQLGRALVQQLATRAGDVAEKPVGGLAELP